MGTNNILGRPKGIPNKQTRDLRELMERTVGEPVPLMLLKLGIRYRDEGLSADAVSAIAKAIQYAYPQLKAIELSGQVETVSNLVVYVPDNGRGPKK